MVEKRTWKQMKTLIFLFCNAPFENCCKTKCALRHHIIRHAWKQKGIAKQMNQTLM